MTGDHYLGKEAFGVLKQVRKSARDVVQLYSSVRLYDKDANDHKQGDCLPLLVLFQTRSSSLFSAFRCPHHLYA